MPLSLITESVFARYISTYKEERVHASKVLPKPAAFNFEGDKAELIEKIRQALYFSKIISYAQGFAQLRVASKENNWNLPFADIASIWRDGCIIRSRFLQRLQMLTTVMQILPTFFWMSTSWMLLLSTNKQCVIS